MRATTILSPSWTSAVVGVALTIFALLAVSLVHEGSMHVLEENDQLSSAASYGAGADMAAMPLNSGPRGATQQLQLGRSEKQENDRGESQPLKATTGESGGMSEMIQAVQRAERLTAKTNAQTVTTALEGLSAAHQYAAQIQHSLVQLKQETPVGAKGAGPPIEDLVQPLADDRDHAWQRTALLGAAQREEGAADTPATSLLEEAATADNGREQAIAAGVSTDVALAQTAKLQVLLAAHEHAATSFQQDALITARAVERTARDEHRAGDAAASSMITAARAQYKAKRRQKRAQEAAQRAAAMRDPAAKQAAQHLSEALAEEARRSMHEAHSAIAMAADSAETTKAKVEEASSTRAKASTAAQLATAEKAKTLREAKHLNAAQETATVAAQHEAEQAQSAVEAKKAKAQVITMKKQLVRAATKAHLRRIAEMMQAEKERSVQLEANVHEDLKERLATIHDDYAKKLHRLQADGDMWADVRT